KADAEAALAKAKDAWGAASTEVPKMVEAMQKKVDTLTKTHHLPKGVTKEGLASAKSSLEVVKSTWSDASNAAGAGEFTSAMTKVQEIKDRSAEIMKSLGMSSG